MTSPLRPTRRGLVAVYRVENDAGSGPYNPAHDRQSARVLRNRHQDAERHPAPCVDGLEAARRSRIYRYGFASLADLSAWFAPDELRALAAEGYRPRRYWVDARDVLVGGHQVAFIPPRRRRPASRLFSFRRSAA